jgi:hypothetical protein
VAVDLNQPIDALITLLKTLDGLADEADGTKHVHKGVPASLPTRLSVYVALGDIAIREHATQIQSVTATYAVNFGYRVEGATAGATATAETALLAAVADFIFALALPANRSLGGVARNVGSAATTSGRPEYAIIAGSEFRVFGLLVNAGQLTTY